MATPSVQGGAPANPTSWWSQIFQPGVGYAQKTGLLPGASHDATGTALGYGTMSMDYLSEGAKALREGTEAFIKQNPTDTGAILTDTLDLPGIKTWAARLSGADKVVNIANILHSDEPFHELVNWGGNMFGTAMAELGSGGTVSPLAAQTFGNLSGRALEQAFLDDPKLLYHNAMGIGHELGVIGDVLAERASQKLSDSLDGIKAGWQGLTTPGEGDPADGPADGGGFGVIGEPGEFGSLIPGPLNGGLPGTSTDPFGPFTLNADPIDPGFTFDRPIADIDPGFSLNAPDLNIDPGFNLGANEDFGSTGDFTGIQGADYASI